MTIKRDKRLKGITLRERTGCGFIYVTLNRSTDGKPFELFINMGKAGGCASSQCESLGRLISLLFRVNTSTDKIIEQLNGVSCHLRQINGAQSCSDAVARVLREVCVNESRVNKDK